MAQRQHKIKCQIEYDPIGSIGMEEMVEMDYTSQEKEGRRIGWNVSKDSHRILVRDWGNP